MEHLDELDVVDVLDVLEGGELPEHLAHCVECCEMVLGTIAVMALSISVGGTVFSLTIPCETTTTALPTKK